MKVFVGKVTSVKRQKTVTVEVSTDFVHPLYGKRMKKTKNFACHCEIDVKENDQVEIQETRPMSKTKFFKVVRVVSQKTMKHVEPVKEVKEKAVAKTKETVKEKETKPKKVTKSKEKKSV